MPNSRQFFSIALIICSARPSRRGRACETDRCTDGLLVSIGCRDPDGFARAWHQEVDGAFDHKAEASRGEQRDPSCPIERPRFVATAAARQTAVDLAPVDAQRFFADSIASSTTTRPHATKSSALRAAFARLRAGARGT
jgi:hypothetical protein